jgi:hypothetical protein
MHKQVMLALCAVTLPLLVNLAVSAVALNESEPEAAVDSGIEEVIVTGQRPRELRTLMMDFIGEIGDPVSRDRGFARWRDNICVGVHNLSDRDIAQYVADRISLIALEVGLQPGEPGCRPNINIVFSRDVRALASRLVENSPQAFRPFGGEGGTTQGLLALEQFKISDAPIRWWQITMIVDEMGLPAIDLWGAGDIPVIRGMPSRLRKATSDDLWGNLIIVDVSKLGSKIWPQVADYLAMVSLAQVQPGGKPSNHDSILNLFGESNPPSISAMDLSYLRALYEIDTMTVPQAQRGMIASRMMSDEGR